MTGVFDERHGVRLSSPRHYASFPTHRPDQGNRCGCALRGSRGAPGRCGSPLRRRSTCFRRSRARCQPGLKSREPSTRTRAARSLSLSISDKRAAQVFFGAKDPDQILHDALQIFVDGVRAFALRPLEGREHLPFGLFDLRGIERRQLQFVLRALRPPVPLGGQTPADRKENCRPAGLRRAGPRLLLRPRRVRELSSAPSPHPRGCRPSCSGRSGRLPWALW